MSGKKMVLGLQWSKREWDTHQMEVGLAQKKDSDQNMACSLESPGCC